MKFSFEVDFGLKKKAATFTPSIPTQQPIVSGLDSSIQDALNSIFNNNQSAIYFMYHYLPEFTAPINYKLDKLVDIPLRHVKKTTDGYKDIENSKVLSLLEKPNQFQTRTEFLKYLYLNLILNGEVFENRIKQPVWGLTQLYTLPADKMAIDWINDTQTDYRLMSIRQFRYGITTILPEECVWRKEVNSYEIPTARGFSQLRSLLNTGKTLQAIYESAIKTLSDRGALGLISPEVDNGYKLDPSEKKAIEDKFGSNGSYGITGTKSPIATASIPLRYTPMAMNLTELQLNETQLRNFRNCCMVIKVPGVLLGDLDGAALNNMKILEKAFYENSIKPTIKWTCELLKTVFELPTNEFIIPDYSDIEALQPDRKLKVDIANSQYNAGYITGDEARVADDYDEIGIGLKTETNGKEKQTN